MGRNQSHKFRDLQLGWGRYERRDWLVDWHAEDLREVEIPKVVW
jgi:hypothetical protein